MALDSIDLRLVRMRLSRVRRQLGDYTGFFLLWDEQMDEDIGTCLDVLDLLLDGGMLVCQPDDPGA